MKNLLIAQVRGFAQSKAQIKFGAVLARQLDVERVGRDENMHQRALDQVLVIGM